MAAVLSGRALTPDDLGFGSSLTIEETSSPTHGGLPRVLVLTGSSLPKMGAEWAVEQNVVTTWYPGNGAEATQQVLGPKEMPSMWEGTWRRTLLGQLPVSYKDETGQLLQLIDPMVIREVVEDFCRAGQKLRVTWAVRGRTLIGDFNNGIAHDDDFKIVRVGRLAKFSTPIDKHTDMGWKAEFHWSGRGDTIDKVAQATPQRDLAFIANGINASMLGTQAAITTQKFQIDDKKALALNKQTNHFTMGQLETLALAPSRVLQRVLDTFSRDISRSLKTIEDIGGLASRTSAQFAGQNPSVTNAWINFVRKTESSWNAFGKRLGEIPPELKTSKPQGVAETLQAQNYYATVQDQSETDVKASIDLERVLKETIVSGPNRGEINARDGAVPRSGDILAVILAKEGDTAEQISMRFYKVSDRGVDILKANRLPWHTPKFHGGQILVIPV